MLTGPNWRTWNRRKGGWCEEKGKPEEEAKSGKNRVCWEKQFKNPDDKEKEGKVCLCEIRNWVDRDKAHADSSITLPRSVSPSVCVVSCVQFSLTHKDLKKKLFSEPVCQHVFSTQEVGVKEQLNHHRPAQVTVEA